MSDLVIDADDFARARIVLRRVIDEFERTDRFAHETAELTGHDGLRSTVRNFADGWDVGRGKLSENLRFLSEAVESILETFSDLDARLAGSISASTGSALGANAISANPQSTDLGSTRQETSGG
jgi:hypothetical protein